MEKDGLASIINSTEKSNLINLVELKSNKVTFDSLIAFNLDGSMRKTQKSKALEKCNMSPTANCLPEYVWQRNCSQLWIWVCMGRFR